MSLPAVRITGDTGRPQQYAGEHGCRTYISEQGRVCMAAETVIHDGRMYCDAHAPAATGRAAGRIPSGVQAELDAAAVRTGDTAALILARHRLGIIFSLSAVELERVTAELYQRTV